MVVGLPDRSEAAAYYEKYIDRISNPDILGELESQRDEFLEFLAEIPPEIAGHRYAPDKWSILEVLNHINDTERVFAFRAFWFGRGFEHPLPSWDQEISARNAGAATLSWERHIEEFRAIRVSTLALLRGFPAEAWARGGVASGNPVTVRALAYIAAGHVAHHWAVLKERYL
jgi:hypothetical protein